MNFCIISSSSYIFVIPCRGAPGIHLKYLLTSYHCFVSNSVTKNSANDLAYQILVTLNMNSEYSSQAPSKEKVLNKCWIKWSRRPAAVISGTMVATGPPDEWDEKKNLFSHSFKIAGSSWMKWNQDKWALFTNTNILVKFQCIPQSPGIRWQEISIF